MTKKELLELQDKVNNPLAIICAHSEILLELIDDGEEYRKHLKKINKAGWKISEYIKNLRAEEIKEERKSNE